MKTGGAGRAEGRVEAEGVAASLPLNAATKCSIIQPSGEKEMPIGKSLAYPEGFCSIHSRRGQDSQPQVILDRITRLPKREGSPESGDRHKCPYCSYIQGYLDALEAIEKAAPGIAGETIAKLRRLF